MNTPLAFAEPVNVSNAKSLVPHVAQPPLVASDAVNDGKWRNGSSMLRGGVARVQHWIRSLGPYLAIELILPGGTIIALALWAYRQRRGALGNTISSSTKFESAKARAPLRCMMPCVQR